MRVPPDTIAEFRDFFEGFEAVGLRIELDPVEAHVRFQAAESEEARTSLGRLVRGSILDAKSGGPVGRISRELGFEKDGRLIVVQDVLRLSPEVQRRGFGGALHEAAESLYRRMGVQEVRADPEGDGSLFLARRGFDFDWEGYSKWGTFQGLSGEALITRVLYVLLGFRGHKISVDPIRELTEYRPGPPEILASVESSSEAGRVLVAGFRERQPQGRDEPSLHPDRFRSPQDIERFGRGESVPGVPPGLHLGKAVLCGMMWRARKVL